MSKMVNDEQLGAHLNELQRLHEFVQFFGQSCEKDTTVVDSSSNNKEPALRFFPASNAFLMVKPLTPSLGLPDALSNAGIHFVLFQLRHITSRSFNIHCKQRNISSPNGGVVERNSCMVRFSICDNCFSCVALICVDNLTVSDPAVGVMPVGNVTAGEVR